MVVQGGVNCEEHGLMYGEVELFDICKDSVGLMLGNRGKEVVQRGVQEVKEGWGGVREKEEE